MKNRVRELRTAAGLTQQQLAEQVRVSSRTIISLEKGQYNPSLLLAYRIAVLFGVTVEKLYCLEENRVWRKKNMKIYHKKNFSEGTLLTGLGLLLLVTMLLRQSFRPKSVLICTAALLLGLGLLFRSLSRQCARADRLEELDERNLLIQLRSKGLAFTIVQNALLVLCLLSAAGGVRGSGQPGGQLVFGGMLVLSGLLWFLSFLVELLCGIHYERRL